MGSPLGSDILILEDDGLARQGLIETLEHAGYRAIGAANGVEGLAKTAEVRPRLILLDMVMPEMDGFEFLARLRADAGRRDIPVLIISSLGSALRQSVDQRGADALGIFGIMPKPIDPATLLELVGLMLSSPPAHERGGREPGAHVAPVTQP